MPSTYSPSLRIELVGDGEQDGIWGQTTNNNLGSLIEQAITGVTTVSVTSSDLTLTSYNGTLDEARSAVLIVNGSNTVTRNITIPNEPKTYIVTNNTTQIVGIKTSSGTAFNCPTGTQTTLYCDGSNGVFGASTIISNPTYQTLNNPLITGIRETATISATAATGTINYDYLTQAVLYYTSTATGNWVLNFRGNSTTTLSSLLSVGQSASVTFIAAQPVVSAAFTATIASTTMTVAASPAPVGTLYVGQTIVGTGVTAGTTITSFGSGSGGAGTYNLSTSSTVASATAMTGSVPFNTGITIDGTSYSPFWQGGSAPTTGNANGLDAYTYAIIKTSATPTYAVLASQTQFKA